MEVCVQLKICEGCGCLWYRAQAQGMVYCKECQVKLGDFPEPVTRRRRGRPCNKPQIRVWTVATAAGGAK